LPSVSQGAAGRSPRRRRQGSQASQQASGLDDPRDEVDELQPIAARQTVTTARTRAALRTRQPYRCLPCEPPLLVQSGSSAYSRSPAASKRVGSLLGPGSFHNPVWVESLIPPSSWVVRQLQFRDAGEGPQAA
jgi:hypothetical protein